MTRHAAPDARRAQILEAALACFAARGLDARMEDIVHAAGLSKGALYHHFRSKDEIFLALFDAYEGAILADWAAADTAPALEALRRQGDAALARLVETRAATDLWIEFLRHAEARRRLAAVYARARAHLRATVARGIAVGEIRPEVDAAGVAAAITGIVEGLLLQALVDPDFDPAASWAAAWTLLTRGMAPEAQAPG